MADDGRNIAYSLPHIITTPVQCSFGTYFWEMYTTEFGWSKAEYGTVQSLFNATQFISFLVLGCIFIAIDMSNNQTPRQWSLGIEAVAIFIHAFSYFLLIYLSIRWHGVKTPYVDSMLGNTLRVWTLDFWRPIFKGPVSLSSMATSRFWWIIFGFPWCFVKFFWVILYIPMKVCFFCGVSLMGLIRILPLHRNENIPVLATLEFIPPPTCSACCNTTCCNNFAMRLTSWKTFMGTRTFLVYVIVFGHGVGISMFELCNKALPTYIYSGASSDADIKIGKAITVNYYVRSGARLAETFYLLSILFLVLHLPLLPGFGFGTTHTANYTPGTTYPTDAKYWFILAALTIFHGTTFFWIFTGGPLTFYLSFNVLGGHTGIGSFGVFTILIGFAGAQIVHLVLTNVNSLGVVTNKLAHSIIVTVCIPCQFFTFIALYAHDWPWNKCNWINYLLLIITGVVNTIFVAYIYIMMGTLAKQTNVKRLQCLFYGIFYAITGLIVSFSMRFMFSSFAYDVPWINISCKCIQISIRYNFSTVYKGITLVFIALNAIALIPIWIPTHGYQSLS